MDSAPGKGSEFRVHVTVDFEESTKLNPEPDWSDRAFAVLVKSDQLSKTITRQLETWGASVQAFTSGDALMSQLTSDDSAKPHAVIVDDTLLSDDLDRWDTENADRQYAKIICLSSPGAVANEPQDSSSTRIVLPRPLIPESLVGAYITLRHPDKFEALKKNRIIDESQEDNIASDTFAGQRILIVDDQPINILVAEGLISRLNVKSLSVSNGQEAIDALKASEDMQQPFSLILMDCLMPVLDGFSASRMIRDGTAGERYKQVPIIALTAGAMVEDREKCLEAGMSDFISKPVTAETLIECIKYWLGQQHKLSIQDETKRSFGNSADKH